MYHSAFATLPVENGDLKSNSGCLPRELSSVKLLACLSDAELFHYLELSIRVPFAPLTLRSSICRALNFQG